MPQMLHCAVIWDVIPVLSKLKLWIKIRSIPNERIHNVCIIGQNAMRVAGKEG